MDLWWSIADAARRLSLPTLDPVLRDGLADALHRELAGVATLENFCAFPDKRQVTTLREHAGLYQEKQSGSVREPRR